MTDTRTPDIAAIRARLDAYEARIVGGSKELAEWRNVLRALLDHADAERAARLRCESQLEAALERADKAVPDFELVRNQQQRIDALETALGELDR